MKSKKIISLMILSISLTSCGDISGSWQTIIPNKKIITSLNNSVEPFNTTMSLRYFNNDKHPLDDSQIETLTNLYTDIVNYLHKIFDRHYSYYQDDNKEYLTNLRTINQSLGKNQAIKCDERLYSILKQGVELFELTDGYFNIFTGTLTDYWDDIFNRVYNYESIEDLDPYFSEASRRQLENIVKAIPKDIETINKILVFDDANQTVTFNKIAGYENVLISIGGIAKGYATDLIKQSLLENGYNEGYLYSGGSSITMLGKPIYSKESNGHSISVVNPKTSTFFESKLAFQMAYKKEFSFSTSGNSTAKKSYSFLDSDNNTVYRHHIFNPYTGYPTSYYHSVSVSSSNIPNITLDGLSTAFMNLDVNNAIKLAKKILERNPKYELELFLLSTETDENGNLKMYTNSKNSTLVSKEGVVIIYEK